jgi:hypothetical protein
VKKSLEKLNESIPEDAIGIHGTLYDISKLNHPGGHVFIYTSLGTDATSLFETHHLNIEEAQKKLKELPILGYYKEYNKYDYSLYTAFKKMHFKNFPTKASRQMNVFQTLKMYTIITLTFFIHLKMIFNSNIYMLIPLCIFSSYLNAICGGYGHNAIHRIHPVSVLLDWNGLSCYEWLLEHVQSHHMHVNTELDNDSTSMEPFLVWLPSRKTKKNKFAYLLKHVVFLISELVVAFNGIFVHRARWSIIYDNNFPLWMRIAPLLFILRFASHIIFSGLFGVYTFVSTLCLSSYLFSYLAHLNHTYESDSRPNFLIHQIKNTKNINSFFKNEFILFLDRQREHHLFPMIDQTVLEVNRDKLYSLVFLNKLLNKTLG